METPAPWGIAVALAGAIAFGACRVGSLRVSGGVAAFVLGALALRAAWSWGAFLIGWFVLSSLLSRIGRAQKAERTSRIVEKGDQRDVWQVLANGGVFATCALWLVLSREVVSFPLPAPGWLAIAAAGALVAAGADTWATEVGTLLGGTPWSIRDWTRVPPGTSGAVSLVGTLGALGGALLLAMLAAGTGTVPAMHIAAVGLGGVGGASVDTVIGAWWQERRTCPTCETATERLVHDCGSPTQRTGGIARLDNDIVNGLCTLAGATIAVLLTHS